MASKHALLIGISSYGPGVQPLPNVQKDVEAMREILLDPVLGDIPYNQIEVLMNPGKTQMGQAIEKFYITKRKPDDILIFYYSGHGQLDYCDNMKLLLSTSESQRIYRDGYRVLQRASMLPASELVIYMNKSDSINKVVILDCCHSGAFAYDIPADKAAETISSDSINTSIKNAFEGAGKDGQAVLTSSANIEYALAPVSEDSLSVYTHFIVEGIKSGKAAPGHNLKEVTAEDIHNYVWKKVKESYPDMTPQFFPTRGGAQIPVSKAFKDPSLEFEQAVQKFMDRDNGKITQIVRINLDKLREQLGLGLEDAGKIEQKLQKSLSEYKEKLNSYKNIIINLKKTSSSKFFLILSKHQSEDLLELKNSLGLHEKDVNRIHRELQIFVLPSKSHIIANLIWRQRLPLVIVPLAFGALLISDNIYNFLRSIIRPPDTTSCVKSIGYNISEGERILVPDSYNTQAQDSSQSLTKIKPSQRLKYYGEQWKKNAKDRAKLPEQLIYINNAALGSKYDSSLDYYTIAVAISIPKKIENGKKGGDSESDFAKEILRGVAHLQTKINMGFLDSKNDSRLGDIIDPNQSLKRNHFLIDKGIKGKVLNEGKGLKVIVVNDANDPTCTAPEIAKKISIRKDINGIIGHYSSIITTKTINIYKKNNLAMISSGSTAPSLSNGIIPNFFRTVYTGKEQADEIATFFVEKKIFDVAPFFSDEDKSFSMPFFDSFKQAFKDKHGNIIDIKNRDGLGSFKGNFDLIANKLSQNAPNHIFSFLSGSRPKPRTKLGVLLIPSPVGSARVDAIKLMKKINANNIVGTWTLRRSQTVDLIKGISPDSLGKIFFAVPWDPLDLNPYSKTFVKEAQLLWGTRSLSPVTATTYDAAKVFAHALGMKKDVYRSEDDNIIDILGRDGFKVEDGVTGPIEFYATRKEGKGDRTKTHDKPITEYVHLLKCNRVGRQYEYNFYPIDQKDSSC